MKILSFILIVSILIADCNSKDQNLIQVGGNAQGTTYHISYFSAENKDYKTGFDSILKKIDTSMSTYLPVSQISRINKNDSTTIVDPYFKEVFNKAIEVSEKTEGLFDVTIGPLVNAWGFGLSKKETTNPNLIDSLKHLVGYRMVRLEGNKVIKSKPGIQLDFNAIAQGYSVDVLAEYLERKGVKNYLVELGGELRASGKKENENWKVGIDQPIENSPDQRKLEAIIYLNDKALATSGNYRKFYEEGGQKYSHIIDPRTGYPSKQNLLSSSVLAKDAITADAYATAFMVMGLEKSIHFLSEHKDLNLEVYFIYDDQGSWKTYASESLKKWIKTLPEDSH